MQDITSKLGSGLELIADSSNRQARFAMYVLRDHMRDYATPNLVVRLGNKRMDKLSADLRRLWNKEVTEEIAVGENPDVKIYLDYCNLLDTMPDPHIGVDREEQRYSWYPIRVVKEGLTGHFSDENAQNDFEVVRKFVTIYDEKTFMNSISGFIKTK